MEVIVLETGPVPESFGLRKEAVEDVDRGLRAYQLAQIEGVGQVGQMGELVSQVERVIGVACAVLAEGCDVDERIA